MTPALSCCSSMIFLKKPASTLADHALASRHFVHRRLDRGKPLVYLLAHFRMGEDVEFVLADRCDNSRCDLRRVESCLQAFGDPGEEQARRACGIRRLGGAIAFRPVARALSETGTHIPRAH